MDYEKVISLLFDYFYNKIYKTNFRLDLSFNNQQKIVSNFVDLLARQYSLDSLNVNFFITYMAWAFSQYSDKELKRRISLNWIIGKKLLQRWLEKKDSWDYYTSNFLREYDINIDTLRSSLVEEEQENEVDYLKIHNSEEIIKSQLPDTEARIYNCLNGTTLYNHRSLNCVICHQRGGCKQLLKKIYPEIAKKRGYLSGETQ